MKELIPEFERYDRCGCSKGASYSPTAALSQAAYGSSIASGPACGQCFNLTLRETFGAVPTWVLSEEQKVSTVVKIVVSFVFFYLSVLLSRISVD